MFLEQDRSGRWIKGRKKPGPSWGAGVWGEASGARGEVSVVWGEASGAWGEVSGVQGEVSVVWGEASGAWGEVSGHQMRRTFRSTVIRVTLAIPAGEVRQDPLTLLRLPHQWEGLQESSGGQCKGVESFPDP